MMHVDAYCENCGSESRFVPIFAVAESTQRCMRCGGWTYSGPIAHTPEQLYGRDYFFGGEYIDYGVSVAAQRKNFARKLALLERSGSAIRTGDRVLEVGCATGEFLSVLHEIPGVRSLGIEVSSFGRAEARARGFSVLSPDDAGLMSAIRELRPNLIVAWDVWEHLAQPATIFGRYLEHADESVVVAATTVDASSVVARWRGRRWRQYHPPTHLQYPTRRSFAQFFSARSLEVVTHCAFGYHRPLLEYALAAGLRVPAGVAPGLLAAPIYLNLWDTQLVIARRQA